jgi:hypothetical protein
LCRNCFLNYVFDGNIEGRMDGKNEEGDVSSYRIS